jgi:hypothetical protein
LRRSGSSALAVTVACWLTLSLPALLLPGVARADDEAPKPAPRTTLQIGGASIVLIAANDHLYAFVDRVEDNAPVRDAELSIDSADGTALAVTRASEGLFAAPFNRAGHMHDAFMVSLRSPDATGDAPAEIAYDDLPEATASDVRPTIASKLSIALVSGGIGAIGAALFMLWLRGGRKQATARPVGTAQAA